MTRSPLLRWMIGFIFGLACIYFINRPDSGDSVVSISDVLNHFHLPSAAHNVEAEIRMDPAQPAPGDEPDVGAESLHDPLPDVEHDYYENLDPNVPVPFCTNAERLELLHSKCHDHAMGKVDSILDLPKEERFGPLANIFVDTKHKVLACLPPKSGCTTWKNILANNSRDEALPPDFGMMRVHFGELTENYGIKFLIDYNETMQRYFLDNYYKFMISRHPLERFRSAYIDKLQSGRDRFMQKQYGGPILNRFRPDLKATVRENGRGVTVSEFTKYLKETNDMNPHWTNVDFLCRPCLMNYDRILKTETLDHDNEYIILNYMKPYSRGVGTKGNTVAGGHQDASLTLNGRELEVYDNSSIVDMVYLNKMYKADFDYFGYSWKYAEENGKYSVHSSCVSGANNRTCC